MRVCMLAYTFYESDPRVGQYAAALTGRGDKVDVIALRRKGQPKREVLNGVNLFRIQYRAINERGHLDYLYRVTRFLLHSAAVLARRHLAKPYDLMHVHSVPDFLVFAALVPKVFGAAVILDIHDLLPELYASKFGDRNTVWHKSLTLAEKCSCAFADHVIVANDLWRERLVRRSTNSDKCTSIRNYPDPARFRSHKETRNGKFLITYPGTLNHHQGLEIAIRAFARVADRMPGTEFHIYGEGPDKPRLIQVTKALHLEDRVFFHGTLSLNDVARVMVNTDLAVEPKLAKSFFSNEAASTKILEFMAAGVPVVASRTRIHAHYYDDSIVMFYDSDNEVDLAECIISLWRDPQLRDQMVSRASTYVQQNNWDAKKRQYLELVDAVVARNWAHRFLQQREWPASFH
jgi:glycosyltransferase involved in cell wall biosynthesis